MNKNTSKKKIFLLYFIVLVVWLTYRRFTHFNDTVDELIAKPILWLMPLFVNGFKLRDLSRRNTSFKKIVIAGSIGIGLSLLQILPLMILKRFHANIPNSFTILLFATIGTALTEEVFFRGFIQKQLRKYYNATISISITSILFLMIHIPILVFIYHYTGVTLIVSLYTIGINSAVFGILYEVNKNLWPSIITHYVTDALLLIN